MKIRRGFVSNSSTSSFMIYGITIDPQELIEKFKISMTDEQIKAAIEKWVNGYNYRKNIYKDKEWKEILNEALEKNEDEYESIEFIGSLVQYIDGLKDFSVKTGPEYYEDLYIGISPTRIGDDETGKEFKTRVKNGIKLMTGEDLKCSYMLEAWRDG